MAILYVFTINNPSDVEMFPPSVMNSDWFRRFVEVQNNKSVSVNWATFAAGIKNLFGIFLFNDEIEYNSFVSTCKLTDPVLISDLETWKSAHNLSYDHRVYNLIDTGLTVDTIV